MARQSGIAIENNFVRGLITESTALKFPTDACTETYNCVFDSTGRVTRRLGIDYEPGFELNAIVSTEDEVYVEYQWYAVAGDGLTTFLVQQRGATLWFFDVSTEGVVSTERKAFEVDLNDYLPTNSTFEPEFFPCAFAQGRGKLNVVNEVCDPFFITYDPDLDSITAEVIELQFRDFEGLDDGLELSERPTSDVAAIKLSNSKHYYNLLNQGWYAGDALSQWDTARSDLPSNSDVYPMFRASETDIFDNARVAAQSAGNTPAPKGHFILDVANVSRTNAMIDEGFTGAVVDYNTALIPGSYGSVLNTGWSTTAAAFDGDNDEAIADCATSASANTLVLGKTLGTPTKITEVRIYGASNGGLQSAVNQTVTIYLRAKTGAAPVLSNEGDLLAEVSFTDSSDGTVRIITVDPLYINNEYDHVYMTFYAPNLGAPAWALAEMEIYTTNPEITFKRPSAISYFAGRVWYAGINASGLNGNIYFSQIIETDLNYGRCYQANDPTAEDNAQLLPTDGGVIRIPEIGNVVKLFSTQNSLLIFATNGVWLVSGAEGSGFDATSYSVSRLSSIGTTSGLSFVDISGLPFWWAESDIYTAQYDPNYNSYKISPITTETIQGFIREIPESARKYIKGAYNLDTGLAAWLFNREDAPYIYTETLIMDTATGAVYPWTVSDGPLVRGVTTISVGDGSTEPRTILTTTSADGTFLTYSAVYQPTYLDWESAGDGVDYDSYFVTGYRVDGQAYRHFQSNYVWVYMETEENASCFMRGQFDFANHGDSGKFSTSQQVYNIDTLDRDVVHRRLLVRGKGKCLQLRFESEEGKPFTIIGWVIWETSNAAT